MIHRSFIPKTAYIVAALACRDTLPLISQPIDALLVNQNQTYRQEIQGGYLWSPKRNANGARNPFYESMREVSPGDIVFSFVDTRIAAIGIGRSYCWESPKGIALSCAPRARNFALQCQSNY